MRDYVRRRLLRFALWLAEQCAPPNPMRDFFNRDVGLYHLAKRWPKEPRA